MTTRTEVDGKRARKDWRDAQARFVGIEQEETLDREDLKESREQSARLARVAEGLLRQLTAVSARAQAQKTKVTFLQSQMCEVGLARDDATNSADKKGRQTRMLESLISLLKDKPDLLTRKGTTGCNIDIVSRKATDAKDTVSSLANGLRRNILESFASI